MNRHGPRSLLLAAAAAVSLMAAYPASATTLADALATAYQTSPLLKSNQAALRSLDENVPQARAARRPQVSADVSATKQTNIIEDPSTQIDALQAALTASLTIYDHGQSKAALEAARNTVAAGRADLKRVEMQVLFNAVQAYVDVLKFQEFVRIAKNDVDRLNETLGATRDRFDVGEVTRTDVSQSELRLAASRSTLAATEGQLEVAKQTYKQVIGIAPANFQPTPPLPKLAATLEEATNVAMKRNPSIISAQYAERAAVYNFDRARAAKGPTVAISGQVGVQRGNSLSPFTGGTVWDGNTFGSVGIEGSMPLYTGGSNDSLIRQAQAVLEQRQFELQDSGRVVTESVAEAWSNLDVARASIVARREQSAAAKIAAEGVTEEARLGARSTLDVLDAVQEQLSAEAEVVRARSDEYVAAYGVLQAMGLLTVEHLKLGVTPYNPDVNYERVQNGRPGGYDTTAVDRIRGRWEQQ